MIEVVVPQDITEHKSKFVGNLTTRQVVCGGLGVTVALFMFFVVFKNIESVDTRMFITAIFVVPFVLVGFVNLYGQPFEKIAPVILFENYLCPPKRFKETRYPEFEKFEKTRRWLLTDNEEETSEDESTLDGENSSTKTKTSSKKRSGKSNSQNNKEQKSKIKIMPSHEFPEIK